eukprot:2719986-Alexandrium_andersonii.AAC.1
MVLQRGLDFGLASIDTRVALLQTIAACWAVVESMFLETAIPGRASRELDYLRRHAGQARGCSGQCFSR